MTLTSSIESDKLPALTNRLSKQKRRFKNARVGLKASYLLIRKTSILYRNWGWGGDSFEGFDRQRKAKMKAQAQANERHQPSVTARGLVSAMVVEE